MTSTVTTFSQTGKRSAAALHAALWIVQGLLFLAFGMAGALKTLTPLDELAVKMAWVHALPGWVVRFIGGCELSGALGLILPSVSRIRPGLTPLAAAGLVVVMALAMAVHVSRGELGVLPINLVLGGMALFVAWGRWRRAPILAR
jgi:putative oxidoreductase